MPAIPVWKFVPIPIPPINSFTNWFALSNEVIEPTIKTLLKREFEFSVIREYGINNIIEIITWRISKDNMDLNQLLKNPSV